MAQSGDTVRLLYPQWQGAEITRLVPEIADPAVAARGYALGSALLGFLAPQTGQETLTVPVSVAPGGRVVTDGVLDRDALAEQTRAAIGLLRARGPARVVTLGGECSASVAPFAYLADRYRGDVALLWVDAHPDLTLPEDGTYPGWHAMALAACLGMGDRAILASLPPPALAPADVLLTGVCDWEREEIRKRQIALGIGHVAPERLAADDEPVLAWLRAHGTKKVLIHLDLDVLDPADLFVAVGASGRMRVATLTRLLGAVAKAFDVVGLTVAEPMPRAALRLRALLAGLPLLGAVPPCR